MLWLCQDSRILLETTICCRKKPVLLRTVEALFQIIACITKPRFAYMLQQYPWFKGLPLVFFTHLSHNKILSLPRSAGKKPSCESPRQLLHGAFSLSHIVRCRIWVKPHESFALSRGSHTHPEQIAAAFHSQSLSVVQH